MIPVEMKKQLEILAGVSEDDYKITERGIEFNFDNSLQANYCRIIEYHDNFIIELRKKTNNILEGKQNTLVAEDIVTPERLQEYFENKTGIYLSYLGL
jgi:hypothetical protein